MSLVFPNESTPTQCNGNVTVQNCPLKHIPVSHNARELVSKLHFSKQGMADKKEKTFQFVIVGGGIAGVTCVEQVKIN